jgi:hypothetical protein
MEKPPKSGPSRPGREYRKGIEAGAISGVVWGGIVSAIFYVNVILNMNTIIQGIQQAETAYTTTATVNATLSSTTVINTVTTYVTSNNITGTQTPTQYVMGELPGIIGTYFFIGLIFGAIIGLIFSVIYMRFLSSQMIPIRSIALALIFWLLYIVTLVGVDTGIVGLLSSLATSVVAGYLLGFLFQRLGGGLSQKPAGGEDIPSASPTRR